MASANATKNYISESLLYELLLRSCMFGKFTLEKRTMAMSPDSYVFRLQHKCATF